MKAAIGHFRKCYSCHGTQLVNGKPCTKCMTGYIIVGSCCEHEHEHEHEPEEDDDG
jgi:hypothetical protein